MGRTLSHTPGLPPEAMVKPRRDLRLPASPASGRAGRLAGLKPRRLDLVALKLGCDSEEAALRAAGRTRSPEVTPGRQQRAGGVAAAILLTTLLALPIVFPGLWATGTELNIPSMMGLTMIVGTATEASKNRMRPILMTMVAAVLALLPLALGDRPCSRRWPSRSFVGGWRTCRWC